MSPTVTLAGRPFEAGGVGERLRSIFRSLRAVGLDAHLRDLGDLGGPKEPEAERELRARTVERLGSDVTVVVTSGGEQELLSAELGRAGRTIACPAWELQLDPERWAGELGLYDEIWAVSAAAAATLGRVVRRPVEVLPLPCHPALSRSYSRRHLGISETAYVFACFFDLASPGERQNPHALVDVVDRLRAARPYAEFQVVVRLGNAGADPAATARFKAALQPHRRQVLLVDSTLSGDQVTSLVRAGDAFVSLHGAEDLGCGPGEAMYFGKPVVTTGSSRTLEYVTSETALLVDAAPGPVPAGPHPPAAGPAWTDPDLEQAAAHMIRLLDDPEGGRVLGARASAHVRTHFSQRACGLRFAARLAATTR